MRRKTVLFPALVMYPWVGEPSPDARARRSRDRFRSDKTNGITDTENGVHNTTLWRNLLGVEKTTIIDDVTFDEDTETVIADVRLNARTRPRCGKCHKPAPLYDGGDGPRRWRSLDLGTIPVYLDAQAPRVQCREHAVTVAKVPWARHDSGHTHTFDQQVAWLATACSKSAVVELMRIAWRTVGAIISRVWDDTAGRVDLFADLERIGIDEVSYKKGHKYLTVVVDHGTGRLVWAKSGKTKATLRSFFDQLEASQGGRCAQITHVSADGADWIQDVVAEKCPDVIVCADPFHVVKWATDVLDEVRRGAWNEARAGKEPVRGPGRPAVDAPETGKERAKKIKNSRYALWKNPEDLTEKQTTKLAWLAQTDPRLHRAYLLKEGLRTVFQMEYAEAKIGLERWLAWAARSRIHVMVELGRKIRRHQVRILAAIEHGLSNGRIESVNTKIRLLTRVAFGFRSPEALIALAMLNLGGHKPVLPGRR